MKELLYYALCPFSRTIILLIKEMGLDVRLKEEKNFNAHLEKRFEFLPIGFPIMIEDNNCIAGSLPISEYFLEIHPAASDLYLGKSPMARAQTRSILSWIERDFFTDVTKIILREKILKNLSASFIDNRAPDSSLLRDCARVARLYLLELQKLIENSEYCAGEFTSLADLAAASNISILDYLGHIHWNLELKRLKYWYSLIKSRPSFKILLGMKFAGFQPSKHYECIDF